MSSYKWNGSVTGSTDPSLASNWLIWNGSAFVSNTGGTKPQSGDTAEVDSGTLVATDATLSANTLIFGGNGALFDLTGNSTLDSATSLTFSAASLTDTLEVGGSLESSGTINANHAGDTLDITIDSGATLENQSYLEATVGTVDITGDGTLYNRGPVLALGGNVTIDASLDGSIGVLVAGNGGTLALNTAVDASQTVVFTNGLAGTTLMLNDVSGFSGRILGFEAGDTIDLANAGSLAVTGVSNNTVTLTGGIALHFPGAGFSTGNVTTASDGHGGTLLTVNVADAIWNSGTALTGDWSTAADWSTGAQPGTSTNVLIEALGGSNYTVTADNAVAGSVLLSSPMGTLAVEDSFTVKHAILEVVGLFDATASATVSAPVFGQRSGGGTLEMDTGSLMVLAGSPSGGSGGNGTQALDIENEGTLTGATLDASGSVLLGEVAPYSDLLVTGSKVIDTYTSIGGLYGGSGTLMINSGTWSDSGDDSSTAYSGDMLVGGGEYANSGSLGGGGGTLVLSDSASLTESANAILAVTMGSTGTAQVQDGATWNITGNLDIGADGIDAQVQVQNGTGATGGIVTVGGTIYLGGSLGLDGPVGTGTSGSLDVSGNSDVSAARLSLLSNNAQVDVSDNALLTIGTGNVTATSGIDVTTGATLDGTGNIFVGTLTDNGTVMADVAGQTLAIQGVITGTGTLAVGSGATLDIFAGYPNTYTNTVAFSGTGDSTAMLGASAFKGNITGFAATDTLDLYTVPYSASNTPVYANGTLTDGTITLDIGSGYTNQFVQSQDGSGNTDITYAPCFAAGTRILTEHGEVPVEALSVGDRVMTLLENRLVTVRWIGHRHVDCRRHPRPQDVWPVRVHAHAFGRGLPHRGLVLSPDHAVYVDGVLIPVRYLVNGATVEQQPADEVTWFHVELDHHDVLLAEGLPAESYLDTGNRAAFANGGKVVMAHPDFALCVWEAEGCAPLVRSGPVLAAVKTRLLAQAEAHGHAMTEDPALRVIAGGRVVPPQRVTSAVLPDGLTRLTWELTLPRRGRRVRLASRVFVPAELYADREDHRRLGVAVERMTLDGVPVAPAARLTGWLPAEDGWQWTDGMATLATGGARQFSLSVLLRLGRYWQAQPSAPLAVSPRPMPALSKCRVE